MIMLKTRVMSAWNASELKIEHQLGVRSKVPGISTGRSGSSMDCARRFRALNSLLDFAH